MNAHVHPAHLIPATEGRTHDLGWALIKATSAATHYSKVKILRTGKRFTYVQTGAGNEWRVTTRGLWTFQTEAAADAELDTLAQIWRDHMPATQARAADPKPTLTYADFLAEARVRQAGRGFAGPLLTVTDEQLARADADVSWRLERARRPKVAANGYRLTAYGLERIS